MEIYQGNNTRPRSFFTIIPHSGCRSSRACQLFTSEIYQGNNTRPRSFFTIIPHSGCRSSRACQLFTMEIIQDQGRSSRSFPIQDVDRHGSFRTFPIPAVDRHVLVSSPFSRNVDQVVHKYTKEIIQDQGRSSRIIPHSGCRSSRACQLFTSEIYQGNNTRPRSFFTYISIPHSGCRSSRAWSFFTIIPHSGCRSSRACQLFTMEIYQIIQDQGRSSRSFPIPAVDRHVLVSCSQWKYTKEIIQDQGRSSRS